VLPAVTPLLLSICHPRHHAFAKASALRALRAKAPLAPEHTGTDRPLCRIIGRLHPFDLHERPQRLAPLQDVSACPRSFGHTTPAARFQESFHLPAKRAHIGATTRPLSCA